MTDKDFNSIYRIFRFYYRIGMKRTAKRRLKALIEEYVEKEEHTCPLCHLVLAG